MKKNRLQLDPLDSKTLVSPDYKRGQLALAAALGGPALGFMLLISANYSDWTGWAKTVVGVLLILAGAWLALRLWRQV